MSILKVAGHPKLGEGLRDTTRRRAMTGHATAALSESDGVRMTTRKRA
jgi:hypothetical protein